MQIVINADDYGLSDITCESILESYNHGVLTSTSVMSAGGLLSDQQIDRLQNSPELGTGGHLSLTVGRPLNDRLASFSEIVDAQGVFTPSYITLFQAISFGKNRRQILKEIEEEMNLQIMRLLDSGIRLDHLNTQQHVHMFPPLFSLVTGLAKKYKIRHVRVSREGLSHIFLSPHLLFKIRPINIPKVLVLNILSMTLRFRKMPVQFYGVINSRQSNWKYIDAVISSLKENHQYEILFHPGRLEVPVDPVRSKFPKFFASEEREKEIQLLCNADFRERLNEVGAELCRFQDIL